MFTARGDLHRPDYRHWLLTTALSGLLTATGMTVTTGKDSIGQASEHHTQNRSVPARITLALVLPDPQISNSLPEAPIQPRTQDMDLGEWHEVVVKRGDTLSSIFGRNRIFKDLPSVLRTDKEIRKLKALHPGDILQLRIHDSVLQELVYEPADIEHVRFVRGDDGFAVEHVLRPVEPRQATASGTITNSLFRAGRKAGLSDRLIMGLASIFGFDIDFALDIRADDRFSVIYEQQFLDGEKLQDGDIIAAEFINQGRTYRAYRYTDSNRHTDYYGADGRSMRKQFLRTPVSIARISSRFNLRRKHPILNRIRAHRGVDYAAPTGTPIMASSNGKVVFRGRKGGYGKAIVLKHGSQYTTLYAHMSRYARNTRVGNRVKQGQTIGYIGKTGLASGPHLHYEFRVNRVHRDPLKVKLHKTEPLPKSELATFTAHIEPLQAQLNVFSRTLVAVNDAH